jgi:HSP20 family molecular chaperone IbpA
VAGFSADDLQVQVEDSQLVIRGRQKDEAERVFLHRGIAARQFQRSFVLAEGIDVTSAMLDNGLLHIDLERPEVEPAVRTIEITTSERGARPARTIRAADRQGS